MAGDSPAFPVRTAEFHAEIGGVPTYFCVCAYSDRVLVMISQTGSLGSIAVGEREEVLGGGATYHVHTVLGRRDDPTPELAARQLCATLSDSGCSLPLLLCLAPASSPLPPQDLRAMLEQVARHAVWKA